MLTAEDVRALAAARRVRRSTRYHADMHLVRFDEIIFALEHCFHVRPDPRRGTDGRPRHPDGHIAHCPWFARRVLRVDLDLVQDKDGRLLAVVTAFAQEPST